MSFFKRFLWLLAACVPALAAVTPAAVSQITLRTKAELSAFEVYAWQTNVTAVVEEGGTRLYQFAPGSAAVADGDLVLTTTGVAGRWLVVPTAIAGGGTSSSNAPTALLNLSATRYVATAADLAACGTTGPSSVVSLSYANAGDGGGGLWSQVPAATYTADGGTVVDGVGCQWVRQWSGMIDPVWFGADRTGAVDSRNAIQAAFNAANRWECDVVCSQGNYRVCVVPTMPIDCHDRSWIGTGGKLWWSLPDGYDFNPATAWSAHELKTFTGVLNGSGSLVTVNYETLGNWPWNGKGFFAYNAKKWDGLWLDGGWGSTDQPTGCLPITGVSFNSGEYVYYRFYSDPGSFTDNDGMQFVNCTFRNMAGHMTSTVGNGLVRNCDFYEMGDHCFYTGESEDNTIIEGNRFYALRDAVGSDYDRTYIFQTKREVIKLQNDSNIQILNNYSTNAFGLGTFVELFLRDVYESPMTNIVIKGNTVVNNNIGILLDGTRKSTHADGIRIYTRIEGNDIDVPGYPIYINGPLGDGSMISGNLLMCRNLTAGALIAVVNDGTYDWQYPVHFIASDNIGRGALSFFSFEGQLGKVNFVNNRYKPWTGTSSPGTTHTFVRAISSTEPAGWQSFTMQGNQVHDCQQLWYSAAASSYSGGTTYTCVTNVFPDYTNEYKPVVYHSTATNVWWKSVKSSVGQTPGVAGDTYWAPYTRPTGALFANDNLVRSYSTTVGIFVDQTTDRRNFTLFPVVGKTDLQGSANSFFSSTSIASLGNSNQIARSWGPLVSGYRAGTETPDGTVPGFTGQLLTTYASGHLYQQIGTAIPFTNWAIIPPFYGVTTTTPTIGLRPGGSFLSNDTHYVYNGSGFVPVNMGQGPITALSVTAVSAAISTTAYSTKYKLNPDADRVLTSAPQITDGFEGQIIYVYVDDAEANTVTFTDEGTHANSNLYVGGAGTNVVISAHNSAQFMFTGGSWNLINR